MSVEKEIVYPAPPADLERGLSWSSMKYFGAGAIIASVTIGSGETVFASRAGSIFGYALLWAFIGSAIMKGIQVYTGARFYTLTGQHPIRYWGLLPGPHNLFPWMMTIISIFCFPFWLSALPLMTGNIVNWTFGIDVSVLGMTASEAQRVIASLMNEHGNAHSTHPEFVALMLKQSQLANLAKIWGTLCIVTAILLTWFQSYSFLEKIQTWIVALLLLSMLAACVAAKPDLLTALAGLLPATPAYPDWIKVEYPQLAMKQSEWVLLGTCLGAVGGGTYDYIGYIGCLREKKWGGIGQLDDRHEQTQPIRIATDAENIARGKCWLFPAKVDVGACFLSVLVFTICFVVLGAVILHPLHAVPDGMDLFSQQARFLTQLHPWLLYLYKAGIFVAFFGTVLGAYEIYIRTAQECVGTVSKRAREFPERKFRAIVLLYCGAGGLLLMWFAGNNAIKLAEPAAIVGGVFACGLWCLSMLYIEVRFMPKALRMGRTLFVLTFISGVVLLSLGLMSIYEYAAGFFPKTQ